MVNHPNRSKKVETLADGKARVEKQKYNSLVLRAFDDLTHDQRKAVLDQRAEVERRARENL